MHDSGYKEYPTKSDNLEDFLYSKFECIDNVLRYKCEFTRTGYFVNSISLQKKKKKIGLHSSY